MRLNLNRNKPNKVERIGSSQIYLYSLHLIIILLSTIVKHDCAKKIHLRENTTLFAIRFVGILLICGNKKNKYNVYINTIQTTNEIKNEKNNKL